MKGGTKLTLDIVMGAVIPALILNFLSRPLGNITAYVLAAFVPVTYVLLDTFVISRRFNAITTYVALSSVITAILVFWFVDGVRYAFKDTLPLVVAVIVFLGSAAIGKPFMRFFAEQVFNQLLAPDTPEKHTKVNRLLTQPGVTRSYLLGSVVIGVQNILAGVVNFVLNINIVTASFNTEAFNSQVAQVNAITRVVFIAAGMGAMAIALWLVYRAIFSILPTEEGKSQFESELWDLINRWDGAPEGVQH
jgi:hypothetical protein